MLSYTLINSHSQVSDPVLVGSLVFFFIFVRKPCRSNPDQLVWSSFFHISEGESILIMELHHCKE